MGIQSVIVTRLDTSGIKAANSKKQKLSNFVNKYF